MMGRLTQTRWTQVFACAALLATAPSQAWADADALEGEKPQPHRLTFVARGLMGLNITLRHQPAEDSTSEFTYGGQLAAKLIRISEVAEFSHIGVGIDFDRSVSSQTILGQLLVFHQDEEGSYFGLQFGTRTITLTDGSTYQGYAAGVVGGVDLPLSDHFSYGPQIQANYFFPEQLGWSLKALLSVNLHF